MDISLLFFFSDKHPCLALMAWGLVQPILSGCACESVGKTLGCGLRLWGLAYQGALIVELGIGLPWEG